MPYIPDDEEMDRPGYPSRETVQWKAINPDDPPDEFTPDLVRSMSMGEIAVLERKDNGILNPDQQASFDSAADVALKDLREAAKKVGETLKESLKTADLRVDVLPRSVKGGYDSLLNRNSKLQESLDTLSRPVGTRATRPYIPDFSHLGLPTPPHLQQRDIRSVEEEVDLQRKESSRLVELAQEHVELSRRRDNSDAALSVLFWIVSGFAIVQGVSSFVVMETADERIATGLISLLLLAVAVVAFFGVRAKQRKRRR
ncbi:hypothetical protein [Mumia sp. DW29H23]|uniref:hypothetical protein n=1 Tax=Mumia sp. DW29H23 TaxID=3421241 RepID=UPI003D69230B